MALATYGNVLVLSNGDTFVGPRTIMSAVLVGGSGSSTASVANAASVKYLDLGTAAASTAISLYGLDIRVGADTQTATLTGTGAKLYLYCK